ncbi:MAG: flagellar export chaperone FlgN [Schwartzia sp.]|nr:flagellar export chaperone FlgN [Schwartzia sp. (in: firmicutes)]
MEEMLRLLEEELSLCGKLNEAAEKQRQTLKDNLDGQAVGSAAQSVNRLLEKMTALEKEKEEFLQRAGAPTMMEAVRRQAYSPEKLWARKLLQELDKALRDLKQVNFTSQSLLARDMDYLSFNINVMTQAQAGPGYAAPEAAPKAVQGRKLFDQSV